MNTYLIWLEWPERCFRANDGDLKFFRSLVPKGSRVVRAKSERAFLKALPSTTHAVVWHFRKEWYPRAPKLRVLATPAAGRELVAWRDAPAGVEVHFGAFHGPIIAETVLGFLIAWTRGFFWKGPMWPRAALAEHCGDLEGTTAVIAGFGRIGRAIAARLEPFGVECFGITRHGIFTPKNFHEGRSTTDIRQEKALSPLLRRADWFILALPSDTGTDDFLWTRMLSLRRSGKVVLPAPISTFSSTSRLYSTRRLASEARDLPPRRMCRGTLFGCRMLAPFRRAI